MATSYRIGKYVLASVIINEYADLHTPEWPVPPLLIIRSDSGNCSAHT